MVRHLLTLARLIVGAVLSALSFCFLLAALLVVLNPEGGLGAAGLLAAWAAMLPAYGVPLLVVFPLAVSSVRFFAARPLRLTWLHLKSVVWFMVAGVGLGAAVYAMNLAGSGDLLSREASAGLKRALAAILVLWAAGTAAAVAAQMRGSRAGRGMFRIALICLMAALPASLLGRSAPLSPHAAAPAAAAGVTLQAGTLVILGLEGATFSEILPLVAEGRLPAFAELIRTGAYGPLATLTPCPSAAAWASVSTGKLPSGHGIRTDAIYSLTGAAAELRCLPRGILFRSMLSPSRLVRRPARPADLLARPAWEILERNRVRNDFAGWLPRGKEEESGQGGMTTGPFPADRWLARILDGVTRGAAPQGEAALRRALAADAGTAARLLASLQARDRSRPSVVAVRMAGPAAAAGVSVGGAGESERGKAAGAGGRPAVSRYYEVLDEVVARIRRTLEPGDYLMVLSAYGEEPLTGLERAGHRVLGLDPLRSGRARRTAGILLLQGPGINEGRQVDDMRVTDVLPLTLYILGLPVGRDMDGRLPRRLFSRPFLEAHPISFVPSYG